MITATDTRRNYHITGHKPQLIEEDLNAAVELTRQEAMKEGRHGILVTRHAPASFTLVVSADVPYGITQELCPMRTFIGD